MMIPTSSMIVTMTASSGLGTLLGPAAVLGLAAVLVGLGVLVVRLAVDTAPTTGAALPAHGAKVLPVLRRAA